MPTHTSPPRITTEYATAVEVRHPLVRVQGFETVSAGEVVIFESDAIGQVISFDERGIDVVSFSSQPIALGTTVYRTGQRLSIPVSEQLLGSVIDPLGNQLQTPLPSKTTITKPVDVAPAPLLERRRITQSLSTNTSIVDLLLPLGKGQRQLLAGDRKTGKTNFAFSAAVTQAKLGSIVVFALIGKKKAEIKRIVNQLVDKGVDDRTVVIATTPQDSVSSIFLTPQAAMTVAEYFRDQGNDVLVILDDLSTHAKFYRELSLLAGKFPGRDSYPGDIFFTHARLLERSGCFYSAKSQSKTAAITCLPIAETTSEDLTEYITSNLISITDGHLLFSSHLFASGQRPAIDSTLSVTRVGKQTQQPLERDITRTLTRFINQYERTKSLTHFGSELSEESQAILTKGAALQMLLSLQYTAVHGSAAIKLLLGCIWNELLSTVTKPVLKDMLECLTTNLATVKQQPLVAKLTQVKSFQELLALVNKEQKTILRLCEHTN